MRAPTIKIQIAENLLSGISLLLIMYRVWQRSTCIWWEIVLSLSFLSSSPTSAPSQTELWGRSTMWKRHVCDTRLWTLINQISRTYILLWFIVKYRFVLYRLFSLHRTTDTALCSRLGIVLAEFPCNVTTRNKSLALTFSNLHYVI